MNSSSHAHNVSISQSGRRLSNLSMTAMVITLALGLIINYINGTLVHTFRKHQIFYLNPRYILFIHLVVNDMIQLTTSVSLLVLANIFTKINVSLCCVILMFAIFTTFNTPFNLAAMAIECYIAVCFPLRHVELCTIKRTYILIGCIWITAVISTMTDIFILVATEPEILLKSVIYCAKRNLFRHQASVKKREVSYIMSMIAVWLTLSYTYIKIFTTAKAANASKTAKTSSTEAKKARNTILLHGFQLLLCMLTYISHMVIKAMVALFPKYPKEITIASYIIVHIFPRLISPIVYGLRDKTFKQYVKKYMGCQEKMGHKIQTASRYRTPPSRLTR